MIHTPALTARDWALLLILSLLWGGSFFFIEIALTGFPVITVVTARLMLAALILHLVIRATGRRMPGRVRVWGSFLAMGVLNNVVPYVLIVWGQTHIASGLAAILNATTPLFTVLAAHVLTADERLSPRKLAGVLLGLAGVAAMLGGALAGTVGAAPLAAQVACLAAAFSYALAGIYGRRFRRMGVAPMASAAGQVTASGLLLLPAALVIDQPWTLACPGLAPIAALVALAGLSTALAYVLYFSILQSAGATNLLLVTFLVPVGALILGIGVLGESLMPRHMLGMALIGAGLAAIDRRLLPRLPRRRQPQ